MHISMKDNEKDLEIPYLKKLYRHVNNCNGSILRSARIILCRLVTDLGTA